MGLREQEETLNRIIAGEIKLVYASPERLRSRHFVQALMENRISMVAVDEAHCISQWGHDFRPDYLRISRALKIMGRPQTIALTATATERVRSDILLQLELRAPRVFITGFDRRNLYWEVKAVNTDNEKTAMMKKRLAGLSGAAIIYTGTRKKVERIAESLRKSEFTARAYHAGMDKTERNRVQDGFMEGRIDLVVATNAFGMGIDRSDIRMVIHHAFPGSIEAYYQESGRAGRDGEPATCLLLYSAFDRKLQEFFIEARYPSREKVIEIYNRLRQRPEDLLWMTYRDIGMLGEEKISELTVASCIKILEDAGVLVRLNRYDNLAELYLNSAPRQIFKNLSKWGLALEKFLHCIEDRYDEYELLDGIQFIPDEMAQMAGLSPEALRRCLFRLERHHAATYIPPFRGRGLRILRRPEPEKLEIDFQALTLRRAYELEKLDQVMAYASTDVCRRHFLLGYFGEPVKEGHCGACDLCDSRRKEIHLSLPEKDIETISTIQVGQFIYRNPELANRFREEFGSGFSTANFQKIGILSRSAKRNMVAAAILGASLTAAIAMYATRGESGPELSYAKMGRYYNGVLQSAQNKELDDSEFTGTKNQIKLAMDCATAVKEDSDSTEGQIKEAEDMVQKLMLIEKNLYKVNDIPLEKLLTMPIKELEKVLTQNG